MSIIAPGQKKKTLSNTTAYMLTTASPIGQSFYNTLITNWDQVYSTTDFLSVVIVVLVIEAFKEP